MRLNSFEEESLIAAHIFDLRWKMVNRAATDSGVCAKAFEGRRSGKQNIAEGSMASGTSKKMELKLVGVARASLEELLLDYQDFSRKTASLKGFNARQAAKRKP